MGEKAVRPGEDLGLLRGGEPRIVLRRPGHVEDARVPGRVVIGVDDCLPHREIRETVRANAAREIELRVILQRLQDLRMDRVVLSFDPQLAVVKHIGENVLGDFDVGIGLPRNFGERIAVCSYGVGVLVAEQVAELVRREAAESGAVLRRIEARAIDVLAEHEGDVAVVGIAVIDFLGETVVRVAERPAVAADVDRRVLAGSRLQGGEDEAGAAELSFERRERRTDDLGLMALEARRRAERGHVDVGDVHRSVVVHILGAIERYEHHLVDAEDRLVARVYRQRDAAGGLNVACSGQIRVVIGGRIGGAA